MSTPTGTGLLIVDASRARSRRISRAFVDQWGIAPAERVESVDGAREKLQRGATRWVLAHASLTAGAVGGVASRCSELRTPLFVLHGGSGAPAWCQRAAGVWHVLPDEAQDLPVRVERALFEKGTVHGEEDGSSAWETHRRWLEHLPLAVCVYDACGELVYVNPAWAGGAEQPALSESSVRMSPYLAALGEGRASIVLENGTELFFERFDLPSTDRRAILVRMHAAESDSLGGDERSWRWDVARGHFSLSGEWKRRLGLNSAPDSITAFESCIHQADLARVRRAIRDALASGSERFEIRLRLLNSRGASLSCTSEGVVLARDGEGAPRVVVGRLSETQAAFEERPGLSIQPTMRPAENPVRWAGEQASSWKTRRASSTWRKHS